MHASWPDSGYPDLQQDTGEVRRRSAEKIFTKNDYYTVLLKDGTRDLTVENTLGRIENDFQGVLRTVREGKPLAISQRSKLAVFTAAMLGRSETVIEWNRGQFRQMEDLVNQLEEANGGPTQDGDDLRELTKNFPSFSVTTSIQTCAPLLFAMNVSILITDDPHGFITSDMPAFKFNPHAYKLPPFYRPPGLGMWDIEVTLPLTPRHLALYTHLPLFGMYHRIDTDLADELNRRTWFHANKDVVTRTGGVKEAWSALREPPDDVWQPTQDEEPEGLSEAEKISWAAGRHRKLMSSIYLPREYLRHFGGG